MSKSTAKGRVYLVGAGPGDPELITWRGLQILGMAEAVCYDALVDPTLIVTLPRDVERHYVGKRAGLHAMPQEQINELLIRLAREGKRVVRLKGGDPFIFGRGGEEALALVEAGIPFEVVPGVTAASAATAYAGMPLTHRGVATWATMLTAHETPNKASQQLPLAELGALPCGTITGYMGISRLESVCRTVMDAGRAGDTPAAVIEWGATPKQRVVRATLATLPEAVEQAGLKPPGLFVIGDTVQLADHLAWYTPGPLADRRILVTRPAHQASRMYEMLRSLGATPIPAPSIQINPVLDEDGLRRFYENRDRGGWIVFTSENGVNMFCAELLEGELDWRALGGFKIAGIGEGTVHALHRAGLKADFHPSRANIATLSTELPAHVAKGDFVVRVRGNLGDEKVERALESAGCDVLPLEVYRTSTAPLSEDVRIWVERRPLDAIAFTSGSTITAYAEQWGYDRAHRMANEAAVFTVGPMTTQIAEAEGYTVAAEADPTSVPGLVQTIRHYFEEQGRPSGIA
ncbi:uroporphyrinogen-III C-methyltransferase [bacterium]|nr:uroporphyrinogen-III C-methyltransferase [bacterium]